MLLCQEDRAQHQREYAVFSSGARFGRTELCQVLAETLFEPSIDDRVSCNFRVLPLSDNWSLCRRLPVWEINSQLPQALVYPYSDRVANTPILHKLSLDLNCWLLQRGHSFCAISRLSGQLPSATKIIISLRLQIDQNQCSRLGSVIIIAGREKGRDPASS